MATSTRQRLIECALDLLATDGLDAVTVRQVARAAGISHGAPLRHFPSRAALLSAVAAAGFAELTRKLTAAGDLAAACQSYVDFARANPALFELMFQPQLASLGAAGYERFRALVPGSDLVATSLWASLRGLALLPNADAVLDVTLDAHVR